MSVFIQPAAPNDAAAVITFMNAVAGESDNLSFGAGEFFQRTAEGEAAFLEAQRSSGGFTLLALDQVKGGPRIVGLLSADRGGRPRMAHRAQLVLAAEKARWGEGLGTRLLERAVRMLEDDQSVEVATLWVRCDNERAIKLYERFGFETTGIDRGLMKIDGALVDAFLMSRLFKRDAVRDGRPLAYLRDVLDAMDQAGDDWIAYIDRHTGKVELDYCGDYLDEDAMDGEEPNFDEGSWEMLPQGRDLDDWGIMRDFAELQESPAREELLDALHRPHAYRRFKDRAGDLGLLSRYFAYQGERRKEIAAEWLDGLGLPWTEGRNLDRG